MTVDDAHQRRVRLRSDLASGRLLQFPGAFTPLTTRLIEELGFDGAHISGAVLSAEPLNVARTIQILEAKGLSGCHLEDQVNPKRCGHLDGKTLISTAAMVQRITAAVSARRDADFVICARTVARGVDGLAAAIARARAYADAGADLIFAEALTGPADYDAFRRAVDVPLLANMTEFGKTPLLDRVTLPPLGVNVVIYPVTLLRLAMGAIENGLRTLVAEGTQKSLVPQMQTRARLYELLRYADYTALDSSIFDFTRPTTGTETPQRPRSTADWPVSSSTPPPSLVNQDTNSLTYRGYPVQDLAASCTFEEVAYLIWHGQLPTGPAHHLHRNALIRPLSSYTGPPQRPVPLGAARLAG